jgi:hypothetical protein
MSETADLQSIQDSQHNVSCNFHLIQSTPRRTDRMEFERAHNRRWFAERSLDTRSSTSNLRSGMLVPFYASRHLTSSGVVTFEN